MKIKLTQDQSDFIRKTYCCIDSNDNSESGFSGTYFQVAAFTQEFKDRDTCIFEHQHISELPKEIILEILNNIIRDNFHDINEKAYTKTVTS